MESAEIKIVDLTTKDTPRDIWVELERKSERAAFQNCVYYSIWLFLCVGFATALFVLV
jgi:hypothetical protein